MMGWGPAASTLKDIGSKRPGKHELGLNKDSTSRPVYLRTIVTSKPAKPCSLSRYPLTTP